jgi:hypothetical protein
MDVCMSVVSVVSCHVYLSATGRFFVQRSPTDCGVSEWDREASITRGSSPLAAVAPWTWYSAVGQPNVVLTLSNPIFLPTAYSPALICFERERGWWITCNYPTVLKEENTEKQKEYNLRYLLAKAHTTWGNASDRFRQQAKKRNKNRVGRLPTSERNRKSVLSDEVRCRIGKG